MVSAISTLSDLRNEVKETQKLVVELINNEDVDTEEWSFIEKKISIISKHLIQHISQNKMDELSDSERTVLKLIHQYYIEMVALIETKKASVSEQLRKFNNKGRLESTYFHR